MIEGIKHKSPQDAGSPVLRAKIHTDSSAPDQYLDINGLCIVDKTFGAAPRLCLSFGDEHIFFDFTDAPTKRQGERFADLSLNARACKFADVRIRAENLPAVLTVISEDQTRQAVVSSFSYDALDRLHDQLVRQVEAGKAHPDILEAELNALPDEVGASEEGKILYAVLNVIRNGYDGTAEADMLTIRRMYWRQRQYKMYPRYVELLNRAIAPMSFGSHGVSLKFADTDISADFWQNLNSFVEFLSEDYGPSFLVSGSLLGLVREGALLAHDDDLDIAILLPATSANEAAEQWVAIRRDLGRREMLNEPVMAMMDPPILKPNRVDGVPVDLFPAWIENGKMFVYPHTYGDLKTSDVLPLKNDTGTKAAIPANPEKMLAVNYGPDWRIPDTSAKLDWDLWGKNFETFLKAKAFENW